MSQDLATFQLVPLGNNEYRMDFGFPRIPKVVEGIQKLVQHVTKQLLTTPGTHRSDPSMGAGLKRLLRKPVGFLEIEDVYSQLQLSIAQTEDQIQLSQEGEELPSDERLSTINVVEVNLDEETAEWILVLEILSESGLSRVIDVTNLLKVD